MKLGKWKKVSEYQQVRFIEFHYAGRQIYLKIRSTKYADHNETLIMSWSSSGKSEMSFHLDVGIFSAKPKKIYGLFYNTRIIIDRRNWKFIFGLLRTSIKYRFDPRFQKVWNKLNRTSEDRRDLLPHRITKNYTLTN